LREVLAAACGRRPDEIGFTAGPFGKPRLTGGSLCFSASHSGDFWAVALAGRELGLDIELIDPAFDRAGTIELFAPGERKALAALSGQAALEAFFACWTRKEAFVKAIGLGLSHPLEAFEVSVGPEPALLSGGEGWRLLAPRLAPGLLAAIAVVDDGSPVELRTVRH
jgi:4'-phosphopantetheinyl transferase